VTDLSSAMADALAAISAFDGLTLGYRTATSGSFTTLTGWVFHKDRVPTETYDSAGHASASMQTATLKGPLSPAMARGYQVQVDSSSTDIWAVESVMTKGQQICLLRRMPVDTLAPDRGQVR